MEYLLFYPSDDLLYKVYRAVFIDLGIITEHQYEVVRQGTSQPMIEVAINEGTITLTTQLKAPIQIRTRIDGSKEIVPLLMNFNIPLALEACKSGEEIHHLPDATAYTIALQHPSQQRL